MYEQIPPSKENLGEALELSKDIIRNIELSELNLSFIVLKNIRLARLLNDFEMVKIFEYESSGYPITPNGIPSNIFKLGLISNRRFEERNKKTGEVKEIMYCESIEKLEFIVNSYQISIKAARDPDISISSANPRQQVFLPLGNKDERIIIRNFALLSKDRLAKRRSLIYNYALNQYIKLKYSKISEDIFSRVRTKVDTRIGEILPDSIKKFTAIL